MMIFVEIRGVCANGSKVPSNENIKLTVGLK